MIKDLILVNGEIMERSEAVIAFGDRGQQFGDGVFELVPVYNGRCFALLPHMIAVEPLRKYIADKAKIRIGEPIHNERIAAIYARREARGFQAKERLADVNGKRTAFEMR